MIQLLVLGPYFENHCYEPTFNIYENLVEMDIMGHQETENPSRLKKKNHKIN